MARDELVAWLDDFLRVGEIEDRSLNGLQLEGRERVGRLAVGVDSTLATIEAAAVAGADFLIVHHGWFWGEPLAVRGPHGRRVRAALEAGLSLYAAHLPLDVHPEVGNNIEMARALALQDVRDFAVERGLPLGVSGRLPVPVSLADLADTLHRITGESCLVHAGGPNEVRTVGIVSGGGAGFVGHAARAGLDCLITGEPEHRYFAEPFEHGISALFAGHYVTETLGVRALAVRLEDTFGLPWEFLHLPTGL